MNKAQAQSQSQIQQQKAHNNKRSYSASLSEDESDEDPRPLKRKPSKNKKLVPSSSSTTTTTTNLAEGVGEMFWDGELRQTANRYTERTDKKPTFRISEIIGDVSPSFASRQILGGLGLTEESRRG
jgi:tyrosyl-DNA phosphodiesterase-1